MKLIPSLVITRLIELALFINVFSSEIVVVFFFLNKGESAEKSKAKTDDKKQPDKAKKPAEKSTGKSTTAAKTLAKSTTKPTAKSTPKQQKSGQFLHIVRN